MVKRFEVWNIELNPTQGSEINKKRPCLVVSPNEANKFLNTVARKDVVDVLIDRVDDLGNNISEIREIIKKMSKSKPME